MISLCEKEKKITSTLSAGMKTITIKRHRHDLPLISHLLYIWMYNDTVTLSFQLFFSDMLTRLASLNHNCMAAHRLGQYFSAPVRLLHLLWASLLDSFLGIGASLKKLSVEFSFFLKSETARSLSFVPITSFAICTTWNTIKEAKKF